MPFSMAHSIQNEQKMYPFARNISPTISATIYNLRKLFIFIWIANTVVAQCESFTNLLQTENDERFKNINSSIADAISATHSSPSDYNHHSTDIKMKRKDLLQSAQDDAEENYISANSTKSASGFHRKTLTYFLKGLIVPMLLSIALFIGFVVYKNRVKRARLQALQTTQQEMRQPPQHHSQLFLCYQENEVQRRNNNSVSNILLESEWTLIRNRGNMEQEDYFQLIQETVSRIASDLDKPPDYFTACQPPTYEQATSVYLSTTPNKSANNRNQPREEDDDQSTSLLGNGHELIVRGYQ